MVLECQLSSDGKGAFGTGIASSLLGQVHSSGAALHSVGRAAGSSTPLHLVQSAQALGTHGSALISVANGARAGVGM